MISVIVPTLNSARDLPGLLSALVPAAVEGVVREVIAADGGSTDQTDFICEDSGVARVTGGLDAAVARAKSEWILFLPPDARPWRGWEEGARRHVERAQGAAVLAGDLPTGGLLGRLRGPGTVGLLIAKSALGVPPGSSLEDLRRRFGRRASVIR